MCISTAMAIAQKVLSIIRFWSLKVGPRRHKTMAQDGSSLLNGCRFAFFRE